MSASPKPTFAELNLNKDIYQALEKCGYQHPTPVQAAAIPHVLAGKDVVVSAQTGTGKTAAFVLPALNRLSLEKPSKKTRILILTPTRELATQVTKAAGLYGKFLRFNIVSLVGGMSYYHQIKDLARGADIIVATPGRLLDHMEQKRVDLSQIEMLILDEADRMLDMGFIDDVEYLAKLIPTNRQTLLFSATVDKKLTTVVKHLLKNPVRIDLSEQTISSPQIKQVMYRTPNQIHKAQLLKQLLTDQSIYKAIIFSATKINADRLTGQLRDQGLAVAALHGDLKQNVRNRTLDQFRQNKVQYLIATDVAARGIDVSDITHVINYDLPRFCEDYVHRIGRTGRAGKTGIAISFVLPTDKQHLQRIERYTGQTLKLLKSETMSAAEDDDFAYEEDAKPRYKRGAPRGHQEERGRPRRQEGAAKPFKRSEGGYKERSRFRDEDDKPAKRTFNKPEGDFKRKPARRQDDERGPAEGGARREFKRDRSDAPRTSERREFKRDRSDAPSAERREFKRDRNDAPRTGERREFKRDRNDAPSGERREFKRDRNDAPRTGERREFKRDFEKSPRRARSQADREVSHTDAPPRRRSFKREDMENVKSDAPRISYKRKDDADKKPAKKSFGKDKPFAKRGGKSFGQDASNKPFKKRTSTKRD